VHGRSLEVRKGLRGQDLNLLPSGYEPVKWLPLKTPFFANFLTTRAVQDEQHVHHEHRLA
jgi:hypothetical protein